MSAGHHLDTNTNTAPRTAKAIVLAGALMTCTTAANAARVEATEWVSMLTEAFSHVSNVLARSPEKITSWAPMTRPAGRDVWYPVWSELGVEARFCDNKLMIYANGSNAKGIGDNWASLQTAERRLQATSGRIGTITDDFQLTTGQGQSVKIPDCMNDDFIAALVPGAVAIMDDVRFGTALASTTTEIKRRTEECEDGQHGEGVTYYQKVTTEQATDGTSDTKTGDWEQSLNRCRDNKSYFTYYAEPCSWTAGPPHNKEMTGVNSWKVPVTIDASGKTYGTPEFVSSTCFDVAEGKPVDIPSPIIKGSVVELSENNTFACGAGFTGSYTETRYRDFKTRSFKFAWDENLFSKSRYTKWTDWEETENTCEAFTAVRDEIQGTGNIEYSGCSAVETQNFVKIYTRLDGTEDVVVTGSAPSKTLANVCSIEAEWIDPITHRQYVSPSYGHGTSYNGPCGTGNYYVQNIDRNGVWYRVDASIAHHCRWTEQKAIIHKVREDGKRFENQGTRTCTLLKRMPSRTQIGSGGTASYNYRPISGSYPTMNQAARDSCVQSWEGG